MYYKSYVLVGEDPLILRKGTMMAKRETKTVSISIRITKETKDKIDNLSKVRKCSKSQVIIDAIDNNSDIVNKKDIYKQLWEIHDVLGSIEKYNKADTTRIREELWNLCQLLY